LLTTKFAWIGLVDCASCQCASSFVFAGPRVPGPLKFSHNTRPPMFSGFRTLWFFLIFLFPKCKTVTREQQKTKNKNDELNFWGLRGMFQPLETKWGCVHCYGRRVFWRAYNWYTYSDLWLLKKSYFKSPRIYWAYYVILCCLVNMLNTSLCVIDTAGKENNRKKISECFLMPSWH